MFAAQHAQSVRQQPSRKQHQRQNRAEGAAVEHYDIAGDAPQAAAVGMVGEIVEGGKKDEMQPATDQAEHHCKADADGAAVTRGIVWAGHDFP